MPPREYTMEQRAEALAVYVQKGVAEASRQTGVPKPTIASWARRGNVHTVAPQKAREATEMLVARSAELRERLRLKMLEKADDLLDRMDAEHIDFKGKDSDEVVYPIAPAAAVQNYATSAAILIDKHLLMSGEATGRTESTLLRGKSDHEQQLLADVLNRELERRAYADAAGDQAADPVAEPATPEPDPA